MWKWLFWMIRPIQVWKNFVIHHIPLLKHLTLKKAQKFWTQNFQKSNGGKLHRFVTNDYSRVPNKRIDFNKRADLQNLKKVSYFKFWKYFLQSCTFIKFCALIRNFRVQSHTWATVCVTHNQNLIIFSVVRGAVFNGISVALSTRILHEANFLESLKKMFNFNNLVHILEGFMSGINFELKFH